MNLLTIKDGINRWSFQINHLKFILCTNNKDYSMIQSLKAYMSKDKSEYRTENQIQSSFCFDEDEIKLKNNLILEITDTYSLNEDKKLTTKSLMLKYLELKLQSLEYFDTLSTLDLLFESLSDEMNEDSMLKVIFNGMNYKQLVKLISPYYEDELQKDEFDMDLQELMNFQLQLIQYIARNNKKYDNIYCILKMNHLNNDLLESLNHLEGCRVLVFTNHYLETMKLEDVCLLESNLIDFADMVQFYYDFSQQSTQTYSLQEVKDMIKEYLLTNYTQKNHDIYQELKNFSI